MLHGDVVCDPAPFVLIDDDAFARGGHVMDDVDVLKATCTLRYPLNNGYRSVLNGMFTSPDPLHMQTQLQHPGAQAYTYAANRPQVYQDPDGRFFPVLGIAGVCVASGACEAAGLAAIGTLGAMGVIAGGAILGDSLGDYLNSTNTRFPPFPSLPDPSSLAAAAAAGAAAAVTACAVPLEAKCRMQAQKRFLQCVVNAPDGVEDDYCVQVYLHVYRRCTGRPSPTPETLPLP